MATTIYNLIDAQRRNSGSIYFPPESDYSSGRQIQNSYLLQRLNLKIKNGQQVSLAEVFQTMEIYEDIYVNAIHGSIEILDVSGGFSKFAITGGETISMVACKSLDNPEILIDRDDLIVYQVTDFVYVEKVSRFKLHFISKSGLQAQKKRLYKTFVNERRISNLIKSIYREIASESDLYVNLNDSTCVIDKDFVSPGQAPLDAIDTLTKRACVSGDYYLFFERLAKLQNKKHFLVSTKTMKNKQGAFTSPELYIAYNITTQNFTPAGTVYRAAQVSFVDNYNHIENMMAGLYNSTIKIVDITSRSYIDMKVNYLDETSSSQQAIESNNYFASYQNFFPEQPGERVIAKGTNDVISNSGGWLKVDLINGVILSMFRLIVDMPGNNVLGTGNYVNLSMPSAEAISLNIGAGVVHTDPVYSGKYLITAVKHTFTNKEYIKKIELSRMENTYNIDSAINGGGGGGYGFGGETGGGYDGGGGY